MIDEKKKCEKCKGTGEDEKEIYAVDKDEYYPVYTLTKGKNGRYGGNPLEGTIKLTSREYQKYKRAHELFNEVQKMIREKIDKDEK